MWSTLFIFFSFFHIIREIKRHNKSYIGWNKCLIVEKQKQNHSKFPLYSYVHVSSAILSRKQKHITSDYSIRSDDELEMQNARVEKYTSIRNYTCDVIIGCFIFVCVFFFASTNQVAVRLFISIATTKRNKRKKPQIIAALCELWLFLSYAVCHLPYINILKSHTQKKKILN